MMSHDLKGKRVLVTGGTRGIGREITRAFVDAGARLVVCYREDGAAAASLTRELAEHGDLGVVRADLSSAADVARLVEECRTRLGGLDVVVLLGDGASIVFVGSKVAMVGVPLRAHYTASKAGLIGLARSMAKELGPSGTRVNVVAPGVIEGEGTGKLPPERHQYYQNMTSLKRLGRPTEIAEVVLFLASPASAYLTGETINVDGGV